MIVKLVPCRPDRLGVEQRHVLRDHPRFLELLDAAQAGRGRQVHLLRQLHVGQATVALQDLQDGPVYRIELHWRRRISHDMLQINVFIA